MQNRTSTSFADPCFWCSRFWNRTLKQKFFIVTHVLTSQKENFFHRTKFNMKHRIPLYTLYRNGHLVKYSFLALIFLLPSSHASFFWEPSLILFECFLFKYFLVFFLNSFSFYILFTDIFDCCKADHQKYSINVQIQPGSSALVAFYSLFSLVLTWRKVFSMCAQNWILS